MIVDTIAPIGPAQWLRSLPHAGTLLARRSIRLTHRHVGTPLTMSDGNSYTAFRETVLTTARPAGTVPAVLQPRFRLRWMGPPGSRRHRLFRRVCVVTTPFFVGIDGFRSKLWMYDPSTGDYAGLYEWDDASAAGAYAEGLCALLRRLSVTGSVSYELTRRTRRRRVPGAHRTVHRRCASGRSRMTCTLTRISRTWSRRHRNGPSTTGRPACRLRCAPGSAGRSSRERHSIGEPNSR